MPQKLLLAQKRQVNFQRNFRQIKSQKIIKKPTEGKEDKKNKKMAKKIKGFFSEMLSSNSGVSSKRVVAIVIIVNVVVFCYIAIFLGKVIPEFMFDSLCLISGGGMGLTAVENIFSIKKGNDKEKNKEEVETQE